MQALKITQYVSDDGYLHIKVPSNFRGKRVELIIVSLPEVSGEQPATRVNEPEVEWDVNYESPESMFGQTAHTLELLEFESGPEDPAAWK